MTYERLSLSYKGFPTKSVAPAADVQREDERAEVGGQLDDVVEGHHLHSEGFLVVKATLEIAEGDHGHRIESVSLSNVINHHFKSLHFNISREPRKPIFGNHGTFWLYCYFRLKSSEGHKK